LDGSVFDAPIGSTKGRETLPTTFAFMIALTVKEVTRKSNEKALVGGEHPVAF